MKIELSEKEIEFLVRCLVLNYAEKESDFDPKDISASSIDGLLIGKLLRGLKEDDAYFDARKERFCKTKLDKYLFLGAGNKSICFLNMLHKRLNFAASKLGGEQQNGGMGTEFDEESSKRAKQDILDVIDDINIAFGLKESK